MLVIGVRLWLTLDTKASLTASTCLSPSTASRSARSASSSASRPHPLGDVLRGAHEPDDPAAVVDDLAERHRVAALDAVLAPKADLGGPPAAGGQPARHDAEVVGDTQLRGLLGDGPGRVQVAGRPAEHLGTVVAEQPLRAGVEQRHPALGVGADDRDARGALDDIAQPVALGAGLARRRHLLADAQGQREHDQPGGDGEGGEQDAARVDLDAERPRHRTRRAAIEGGEHDGATGAPQHLLRQRFHGVLVALPTPAAG